MEFLSLSPHFSTEFGSALTEVQEQLKEFQEQLRNSEQPFQQPTVEGHLTIGFNNQWLDFLALNRWLLEWLF